MPAEPLRGRQLVPPLTGVIEDIGPVMDNDRTVIAIITLDAALDDREFTPACGKRARVQIEELSGAPVAPEYDSVGGGTD